MDIFSGFEMRKFVAPEYVFGVGARNLVGQYMHNFSAEKVLLVTDQGVINAGTVADVERSLAEVGINYEIYSQVSENPREQEVMLGAQKYKQHGCQAIVAVGGGSPMDCAKGIGIVVSNDRHILEFEGVDNVGIPIPPLVCVPTTSGSSADVSQFAIITDTSRKVKIAIVSKTVVPDVALIDPQTLLTMDAKLTACTCMDALTHAIEAYVSNASSPVTDLHALEAIKYLYHNMPAAVNNLTEIELRAKTMFGSLQAGIAFSNAILGAVHSMAHSLGGFLDLPHGECNAILLPRVIEFNYESARERYDKIAEVMDVAPQNLVAAIDKLRTDVGLDRNLSELGVTKKDISKLAEMAIQDPCIHTNPCQPQLLDVEGIYEKAL